MSDIEFHGIGREDVATLHQRLAQIIEIHGDGTLPRGSTESAALTNVWQLLERKGEEFLGSAYKDPITSFDDFQKFSVSNPEIYWKCVLNEMSISFSKPPECILHDRPPGEGPLSHPSGKWLPRASINPAHNCLNVNSERCLNDIVIIWHEEQHDDLPLKRMILEELRENVWSITGGIRMQQMVQKDKSCIKLWRLLLWKLHTGVGNSASMEKGEENVTKERVIGKHSRIWESIGSLRLGLEKGSAIAIDMSMNVKSVVIYLAIVLAGYVVVSIADSFAASEISTRLKISKAKVIFTQSCGCKSPMAVVIPTKGSEFSMKLRNGDLSWHDFLEKINSLKGKEFIATEQPIGTFTNILFSSGTTGNSMDQYYSLKAAADAWCHMDVRKGDVVCWPTNLGRMMGPWLVYASLLNGASMALYIGSHLGSGFAKFVQPQNVPGIGELALGPLMLGASNTLLNADHYGVYFKGMPLLNGKVGIPFSFIYVVSSIEIERICNGVDSNILETAAIGVPPSGGGPELLTIAVVFKDSNSTKQDLHQLRMSFNSALQKKLNPLFRVSQVVTLPSLPRTASNKVMRRVLRQQLSETNQNSKI
ncbi:hypothetical protein JHK82_015893 [Glycine max]|nr:hypothetical protein JHK85_016299 [Glycine max]KAG5149012.1 hypothetical protein JHK82_015893 [Glycine max]